MTKAISISSKVTPEQRAQIEGILSRVGYTPKLSVTWGTSPDGDKDWATATKLARDLAAYKPTSSCLACHFRVLNILREAIDLPPIGGEASESLRTRRLAICRGVAGDGSDACPAYRSATDSCGRLLVDAFTPEVVVMEDGRRIDPCGCCVGVKASFKFFTCPANKWPRR